MKKLNLLIIFGGCSPEYSVSLQSAYSVIAHIDLAKYNPILVGISATGDWYRFYGDAIKIVEDTWCNPTDCLPASLSPNRTSKSLLIYHMDKMEVIPIDVAFPVLHGKNGEDGTIQGLIELTGIPLVGCGTLASALCMDKMRAHKLAAMDGIQVPASFVIRKNHDADATMKEAEVLGYPLFVKPVRAGSSYGITKVNAPQSLLDAIDLAFEYDDDVIIEENIAGIEIGCAILGNEALTAGEVDEIQLSDGFFDFTEKYTLKTSAIHVPARISKEKSAEIKMLAKAIYRALGCRGFARVDVFLTVEGNIIFNEVNTIPGFTSHSRYPNMMKAAGLTFNQVVSHIIELAMIL
ncbi:D-alanine--D-serine ligase VanG [Fusibacter bizertensis]